MKVLIIDNRDSFTYNLAHYVNQFVENVDVMRSNLICLNNVNNYDKIIFSPGPGLPNEHAFMSQVLDKFHATKSILGICLGHQAIGEYFGANLENIKFVKHGVTSILRHNEKSIIFDNLPKKISVGHYHSWIISEKKFPSCLKVTSVNSDGFIMSVKHSLYDVEGVQFHPESIMTSYGLIMIKNWINYSRD